MGSCEVISCHVTATSYELQPCRSSNVPKTWLIAFYSHLQVTSCQMTSLAGHFRSRRSREVISCDVTATSSELQPCRSSNVPKSWLIGLLQLHPSNFRSNDITSGLRPVTWVTEFISCHVTSPVRYSLVGAQTNPKLGLYTFYSHFQVTSGQMTSLPVTSGHVMSFPVT